jgi:hypothetical protein
VAAVRACMSNGRGHVRDRAAVHAVVMGVGLKHRPKHVCERAHAVVMSGKLSRRGPRSCSQKMWKEVH